MTRRLWGVPALLGVATLFGLIAALTGDGWRDGLAWIGLSAPVIIAVRAFTART